MDETKSEKILKRVIIGVLAVIILTVTFFSGYFTRQLTESEESKEFQWVLDSIKKYYYEDLSEEELLNTALLAISEKLDKYSTYYTEEEFQLLSSYREGDRVGLGINFYVEDEQYPTNTILKVAYNSPSEKAGLTAGETILKAGTDRENLTVMQSYYDFVDFLSQLLENQTFYIQTDKIINLETNENAVYELAKKFYNESFVKYKTSTENYGFYSDGENAQEFISDPYDTNLISLEEDTAYISLTQFNGNAAEQFKIAMNKFKTDGKTKLILDLRTNGGGYMDILTEIASHLIFSENKSELIVAAAKYKDGKTDRFYTKTSHYIEYNFEDIAVLANGYTASASECLIGAMLDYNTLKSENLIVSAYQGNEGHTFGKGIMQTTFDNGFGTGIKLTTATIHWPVSDTCIHGAGITGTAVFTSSGKIYPGSTDNELTSAIEILNAA